VADKDQAVADAKQGPADQVMAAPKADDNGAASDGSDIDETSTSAGARIFGADTSRGIPEV